MTRDAAEDLYTLLEKEVRTPKERIPLDAFLPKPEAMISAIARPVAPPPPAESPEPVPGSALRRILGAPGTEETPQEAPPPPRRRRKNAAEEPQKSLEEEVAEFMSRSNNALAPDADPEK